jgi:hypothetical protein
MCVAQGAEVGQDVPQQQYRKHPQHGELQSDSTLPGGEYQQPAPSMYDAGFNGESEGSNQLPQL